ncbi:hypothetical protein GUITHDRAFT_104651 [Guillardia theta CCMP2712]|uniref:Uncharacterized protein n=1 Tax=Guillardia theta (strain CCMP2712) TaxID=905079 RepID=L1JMK7_GUITC|nr:hypothetical protein GUITHDRAFT_104651 [Guillardia theta CCMP2712]EKX49687.1 hypothetical protein GUITHDRAFT_104651 [Guillardia theta CCMP2712]|eukprot:XP_005836667.1 hypothetical protein GUITHDRAFT_104651 [Guillardia theta CCMP2712]
MQEENRFLSEPVGWPAWMEGTWKVRDEEEGQIGEQAPVIRQEKFIKSRGRGGNERVIEAKDENFKDDLQVRHNLPVVASLYDPLKDPTRVVLQLSSEEKGRMCMAVGAVVGRCERREIFLLAQEAAGEGDAFICSETYRSLDVRKQTVKVREFEVIRELRRLEDGSVRGTKSVILYSDPDPVDDPIALARSLGSLRVWSAMTKVSLCSAGMAPLTAWQGKVPRGSVGLDMTERQRARAVTSYVMSYEREGG